MRWLNVCKISCLNSKQLLRKPQKILGGHFILPHPVYNFTFTLRKLNATQVQFTWIIVYEHTNMEKQLKSNFVIILNIINLQ